MATSALQIDPEELKRNLAITLGTQAPQLNALRGPQVAGPGPIAMPQPKAPDLSVAQPKVNAPRGTVEGDQAYRTHLLDSGPGVDQISGKIKDSSFGQSHPKIAGVLGPVAQGLGKVGSLAVQMATPFGPLIPGTEEHHLALLNQANHQVGAEESERQKEAETQASQAEVPLRAAQTQAALAKPDQATEAHDVQLHQHGFKMDETGKIVPLEYGEMSEQQQAVHDLKASQEEVADATAALKKAQAAGIPAQVQMAQQRIQTAQQNARTAAGRLGLAGESLQFREQQAQDKLDNPPITPVAQGRAAQGKAIMESATDLKTYIDKNPEVFGNIGSYWDKVINDTPIADPAAAKAMAKLQSFAALQPALHGMRSHDAMKEFARMVGGIPKNGEALKAAIDGLTESAAVPMIHAGTRQPKTPQGGAPPAGAQVIKWEDVK